MSELAKVWTGFEQKRAADDTADQLKLKAKARRAEGGAAAREDRRQGRLKASRTQAVLAAQGANLSDPTIVSLMGDIGAESEYMALTSLYESETEARGLDTQASATKRRGRAQLVSSVISAGESLVGKYG